MPFQYTDNTTYRFDFYKTSKNEIKLDLDCDYLVEFDICYDLGITTETLHEEIPYEDTNEIRCEN